MSKSSRKSTSTLASRFSIGVLAAFLLMTQGFLCPDEDDDDSSDNDPGVPGQVQNLQVVSTEDGVKYRVLWDEPAGGLAIAGYKVEIKLELEKGSPLLMLAELHERTYFDHDPEFRHYGTYNITPIAVGGAEGEVHRIRTWGPRTNSLLFSDPHTEDAIAYDLIDIGKGRIELHKHAQAAAVYVTNFAEGIDPPLFFASPHLIPDNPADQAATTPDTGFKEIFIRDLGAVARDYPPLLDSTYRDRAEIVVGNYYALYSEHDFYYIFEVSTARDGEVLVQMWRGEFARSRALGTLTLR